MLQTLSKKDDKIVARKQYGVILWYPSTFLSPSLNKTYVQFETLSESDDSMSQLRREYVKPGDVRPTPPPELHRVLKLGEIVEGFCKENKGWRKGTIMANTTCDFLKMAKRDVNTGQWWR
ncbi:hypothetical protein Salat_0334400 [Sesamum alatum]|uniref:Uncharacterized protein n=1 Tax=Sesamum alatum TaxID=300844 RepID=A0AAE1Z0D5_9LAMI|nr:hypothetical protein Salat_0334400 [Sesamum alatum]